MLYLKSLYFAARSKNVIDDHDRKPPYQLRTQEHKRPLYSYIRPTMCLSGFSESLLRFTWLC